MTANSERTSSSDMSAVQAEMKLSGSKASGPFEGKLEPEMVRWRSLGVRDLKSSLEYAGSVELRVKLSSRRVMKGAAQRSWSRKARDGEYPYEMPRVQRYSRVSEERLSCPLKCLMM